MGIRELERVKKKKGREWERERLSRSKCEYGRWDTYLVRSGTGWDNHGKRPLKERLGLSFCILQLIYGALPWSGPPKITLQWAIRKRRTPKRVGLGLEERRRGLLETMQRIIKHTARTGTWECGGMCVCLICVCGVNVWLQNMSKDILSGRILKTEYAQDDKQSRNIYSY